MPYGMAYLIILYKYAKWFLTTHFTAKEKILVSKDIIHNMC
jgi:hypothetical protein